MKDKAEDEKTLIESILNLIDLVSVYLRQQVKRIVDESIAGPISAAGRKAALFILAFSLFSLSSIFIAVGLFLSLAKLVGFIFAYLIIGALLIITGLIVFRQISR